MTRPRVADITHRIAHIRFWGENQTWRRIQFCSPSIPGTFVPAIELLPADGRSHCMKRLLLAVSALAIAGPEALTSANASQGAYVGDCRVIRERIETRRTANLHAYA